MKYKIKTKCKNILNKIKFKYLKNNHEKLKTRKKIIIAGFYGRGNSGDEALLQCACEAFKEHFDIVICVDEYGAYNEFWNWYPYNEAEIIHQSNVERVFKGDIAGVLIGGGGLPIGFGANLVIAASSYGIPVAAIGIDFPYHPQKKICIAFSQSYKKSVKKYIKLFDFISVRSKLSQQYAKKFNLNVHYGADLAFHLPIDDHKGKHYNSKILNIVLREFDVNSYKPLYKEKIIYLVNALREKGYLPQFLPFCPEDERWLYTLELDTLLPIVRSWWNPRKLKQIIASSELTLSTERLHPLIFAAGTNCKICHLNLLPDGTEGEFKSFKILDMCQELNIQNFQSIEALINNIEKIDSVSVSTFVDGKKNLNDTIQKVHQIFSSNIK